MTGSECPICDTDGVRFAHDTSDSRRVACEVCITYSITGSAAATLLHWEQHRKLLLAGHVRRYWADTKRPMRVDSDVIESVTGPRIIGVPEKQNALLFDFAIRSPHPGAAVTWHPLDCVVVDAAPGNELGYHVQSLIGRELVQRGRMRNEVFLTSKGWEYIEKLRSPATGSRSDIFVAMSFAEILREAWEIGIRPAISAAGYRPKRVDSDAHNDRIDDRIIAGIRACYATVVDVTTQNSGAYFEAGFAMGLGRPVVWTVQESDLPKLHFDTRQFNHIVWSDPADLSEKLTNHLLAVFGRGPVSAD